MPERFEAWVKDTLDRRCISGVDANLCFNARAFWGMSESQAWGRCVLYVAHGISGFQCPSVLGHE